MIELMPLFPYHLDPFSSDWKSGLTIIIASGGHECSGAIWGQRADRTELIVTW
jgi:hypothetical protein